MAQISGPRRPYTMESVMSWIFNGMNCSLYSGNNGNTILQARPSLKTFTLLTPSSSYLSSILDRPILLEGIAMTLLRILLATTKVVSSVNILTTKRLSYDATLCLTAFSNSDPYPAKNDWVNRNSIVFSYRSSSMATCKTRSMPCAISDTEFRT